MQQFLNSQIYVFMYIFIPMNQSLSTRENRRFSWLAPALRVGPEEGSSEVPFPDCEEVAVDVLCTWQVHRMRMKVIQMTILMMMMMMMRRMRRRRMRKYEQYEKYIEIWEIWDIWWGGARWGGQWYRWSWSTHSLSCLLLALRRKAGRNWTAACIWWRKIQTAGSLEFRLHRQNTHPTFQTQQIESWA